MLGTMGNMLSMARVAATLVAIGSMLIACSGGSGSGSTEVVGQVSQAVGEVCFWDSDCGANEYCDFGTVDDPSYGGHCTFSATGCFGDVCAYVTITGGIGEAGCGWCYCWSQANNTEYDGPVCVGAGGNYTDACMDNCR